MEDAKSCLDEAKAAVDEVAFAVKSIELSPGLESSDSEAFVNIVTLEGKSMCVRISDEGFRVVAASPNRADAPSGTCYETVYSLLSDISEGFRCAFCNALSDKLLQLAPEAAQ